MTKLMDTDGTEFEAGFEVLLTPRDAATILAVNTRTLSKWADLGKLRCVRVGSNGHRRYPADAVRALSEGRLSDAAVKRPLSEMSPADAVVAVAE